VQCGGEEEAEGDGERQIDRGGHQARGQRQRLETQREPHHHVGGGEGQQRQCHAARPCERQPRHEQHRQELLERVREQQRHVPDGDGMQQRQQGGHGGRAGERRRVEGQRRGCTRQLGRPDQE